MATIVDRRDQPKDRGISNRQRFIERNKKQVSDAVRDAIRNGNVTDIGKGGVDVTVPSEGTSEPSIHHGRGGKSEGVLPGNTDFVKGDRIKRPQGGGGGGGKEGSPDGNGQDGFTFHLSEEEVLNIIFEDLELPHMIKKGMLDESKTAPKRRGFVSQGPFNKLDLTRSKKKKLGRRLAAESPHNRKILELLDEQRDIMMGYVSLPKNLLSAIANDEFQTRRAKIRDLKEEVAMLREMNEGDLSAADAARMEELDEEIEKVESRKKLIPTWVETTDLQFRHHVQVPTPSEKAVMFCLMDVSASMGQEDKEKAKLFFFLLYKYLQRQYKNTEVVFIRHTHEAAEVDEQEFFYGRETGGTKVSSATELMQKIIDERYPLNDWNIYGAHASDGDNYTEDNKIVTQHMKKLMPIVQAFFYTEIINSMWRPAHIDGELWKTFKGVEAENKGRFFMGKVANKKDIVPVFREFFKKRDNLVGPGASGARMSGFNMN